MTLFAGLLFILGLRRPLTFVYPLYTTGCMKGIPAYLPPLMDGLPYAAAILSEDRNILRSNSCFDGWFASGAAQDDLARLNLKKTGPTALRKAADRPGETLTANVYLLNKWEAGRFYLVLLIPEKSQSRHKKKAFAEGSQPSVSDPGAEFSGLIGANERFRQALMAAQRAAKSDISVLIIGESGTGKEILARAIHSSSHRKKGPLVDVNCAAIPDTLIESELFGYEKGAFTGAHTRGRKGYFDEADGGTILLDEIGDSSLAVQSKLLRVLESGYFKRVGGTKNVKVDVRVISSTNQDMAGLIERKAFREDLFYRLNAFTIYLPPLRERPEDIERLADFFLKTQPAAQKKNWKLSAESLDILKRYAWPGNVREFKGVISYAINMSRTALITPEALPSFLSARTSSAGTQPALKNLTGAVRDLEKNLIRDVLSRTCNKSEAIKALGISRRTFYLKLREYGLDG